MINNIIHFFFGDRQNQNADSECENLASIEPFTTKLQEAVQAIATRAIMQTDHNQESIFNSIFSNHENRLAAEQNRSGVISMMDRLSLNSWWNHYGSGLNAAEDFSWDLSEQKSGRGKSDYQRDLFSDSRRYCLHEWRVLYCLKHDAECRPGWSLLHKHYPNLLVRDVLMVLPKETVRHFLAALSGFTDVAHNDEARVLVQPFSLFIKRGESAHVYDIEPLTDWLTLSMYHALAQAVNGGVIAPRSGMVSFDDTVSWDGLD